MGWDEVERGGGYRFFRSALLSFLLISWLGDQPLSTP